MSRSDDAQRVKCPTCGVSPGKACVYVNTVIGTPYTPGRRALVDRVGTHTEKSHMLRFRKLWENEKAAERRAYYKRREEELRDPLEQERVAYFTAVKLENQQLRTWLREHGSVLWKA